MTDRVLASWRDRLGQVPAVWVLAGVLVLAAVLRLWDTDRPLMSGDEEAHYFPEMQQIHMLDFARQRIHPVDLYHAASPGPSGHPLFAIQLTNLVMRAFPSTPATARAVQALAGVAMVGVIYLLGVEFFGKREAVVAALLAAALPLAVRYNRTLYLDSIYSLLVTLLAWTTLRAFRSDRATWTVAAGTTLGLAGATKTSAPLLLLFVVGYGAFVQWETLRAERAAGRNATEAARQVRHTRKGRKRRGRTARPPARQTSRLSLLVPLLKLVLLLAIAAIVFWIDVDPAAYFTAIRRPVDTGYQHSVLVYFVHMWQVRSWLLGVLTFLWTPSVLLGAIAGAASLALRWREAPTRSVWFLLLLLGLTPLVPLHLRGISGEHGYLPFVAPVCLLAAVGLFRLRGAWPTVVLAVALAILLAGTIMFGWRLIPVPYGSYLNYVDFGPEYY